MKIIDEREGKKRNRKKKSNGASYSESLRAKWFFCSSKLGFSQLIFEVSLISKSNLELALSVI